MTIQEVGTFQHEVGATMVVVERAPWRFCWVRDAISRLGARSLVADQISVEQVAMVLSDCSDALIVLELPAIGGGPLLKYINERTARLREILPAAGIVFAAAWKPQASIFAFPDLVSVMTPNDNDLSAALEASRARRRAHSWAARNCENRAAGSDGRAGGRTKMSWPGALANFNIKHPSMLLPFALVSAQTKCDLFCEVSPQEALLYLAGATGGDPNSAVSRVFKELRKRADELNAKLGARLHLHLDHCDDLDLIHSACDAGFDSVMADGSARSLGQNIIFTKAAGRIAGAYGVLLEGEVGCIDPGGYRRHNKTELDELEKYLAEVKVDLVGVHVGQHHSFDYGFDTTLKRLAQLDSIDATSLKRAGRTFATACLSTEAEFASRGFSPSSRERQLVLKLIAQVAEGADPAIALAAARQDAPLWIRPSIDRIEEAWRWLQHQAAQEKNGLWSHIFSCHEGQASTACNIDHTLISDCQTIAAPELARLTVHGGSSISRCDLEILASNGVARVNFGTAIFHNYLRALSTGLPYGLDINTADPAQHLSYLAEATSNWRSWVEAPPAFIQTYVSYLATNYIEPLKRRER